MSSSPPPPCSKAAAAAGAPPANKYCLCAPTTHPGSFRCRLHRSPVEANKAPATAAATAADQEANDEAAAAAAVARELLERMRMARKPRRPGGVPAGGFRPAGPSRLGATTTAMED